MARPAQYDFDGCLTFKGHDFDLVARCEYDYDGYLDIAELHVVSDRRGLVAVSDRFVRKFQEQHWEYLFSQCIEQDSNRREYYRDCRMNR